MFRISQRIAVLSRLPKLSFQSIPSSHTPQTRSIQQQHHQNKTQAPSQSAADRKSPKPQESATQLKKKKTLREMDEELRLKMEGLSGDGGASGVEYEDGKAVSMKRGVRDNMFRYI
ncbi:hypothetical protein QBC40DRAFT_279336 [Triangularia verruculosa]|uniref:Uncharacterized protein n=1 Tax=Triangularia verruculosa TaxID=2587418 RepID=A0AAN7ATN1_9PEZI|nr:hypothetical protein QBC40DRAFT_279336 [Triangularia verruculosa]